MKRPLLDSTTIRVKAVNPKRPKSASYERYELYKKAKSVAEFYSLGGTRGDFKHDLSKGFVTVIDEEPAASDEDDIWNAQTVLDDDLEALDEHEEAMEIMEEEFAAEPVAGDRAPERADSPVAAEVAHMIQFFLCQLRWQYGKIVSEDGSFSAFDAEMLTIDPGLGAADVASCAALMDAFFRGPARGDRWVPWHTVTCDQELFLMKSIRSHPALAEDERCLACFAFTACRCVPLWKEIVVPYLASPLSPDFFALGSPFHERLVAYRRRGHKLHTSAFNCYPPRGASGDAFVDFIADRHVHFAKIGQETAGLIRSRPDLRGERLMDALDKLFRSYNRVGPTMSKVFLVTMHLWYPHLGILDQGCEVGDGANQAFDYLYPTKDVSRRAHLHNLFAYLQRTTPDRRFRPMIAWVARQTRAKFSSIPPPSIAAEMTIYDLQVQLCEWRKFRRNVDAKRTAGLSTVLSG